MQVRGRQLEQQCGGRKEGELMSQADRERQSLAGWPSAVTAIKPES